MEAHRAYDPLEGNIALMAVRQRAMESMGFTDVVSMWQAVNLKEYELPIAAYSWQFALTEQLTLRNDAPEMGWEEWAQEAAGDENIAAVRNFCLVTLEDMGV